MPRRSNLATRKQLGVSLSLPSVVYFFSLSPLCGCLSLLLRWLAASLFPVSLLLSFLICGCFCCCCSFLAAVSAAAICRDRPWGPPPHLMAVLRNPRKNLPSLSASQRLQLARVRFPLLPVTWLSRGPCMFACLNSNMLSLCLPVSHCCVMPLYAFLFSLNFV